MRSRRFRHQGPEREHDGPAGEDLQELIDDSLLKLIAKSYWLQKMTLPDFLPNPGGGGGGGPTA